VDGETPEAPRIGEETFVLRNHPSVIFGNVVKTIVFFLLVILVNSANMDVDLSKGREKLGDYRIILIAVAILIWLVILFWRRWKLTTYTFSPTELTVRRNTLYKKDVHIQYSRLASVNVRRTVLNHVFGTTELLFNVNSSVNFNAAEARLVLKSPEADKLRESISTRIFAREMRMEEEEVKETLVKVSNGDIILHGLFGQPTAQSIVGIASLVYSLATIFFGDGTGVAPALVLFVFSYAVPWVRTIMRYYNYRVYRVDDTITVESGLINNYRSSFNINKVNSVRIRQPLLARFMGKALLEAEVIGLADSEGLPLLCPLKGKDIVMNLAHQLVPEFLFDVEHWGQPRKALIPTVMYKVILSCIFIGIGAFTLITAETAGYEDDVSRYLVYGLVISLAAVIPTLLMIHGILAHGNREFIMGDDTFAFVIGAYDRETDFIRYDKVQKTDVRNGPIQRRFGVAECRVSMMSSSGAKVISSGIFMREDLERIGDEIMSRIRDGRYDYRRYL